MNEQYWRTRYSISIMFFVVFFYHLIKKIATYVRLDIFKVKTDTFDLCKDNSNVPDVLYDVALNSLPCFLSYRSRFRQIN